MDFTLIDTLAAWGVILKADRLELFFQEQCPRYVLRYFHVWSNNAYVGTSNVC